ncbi:hypothetical protein [Paenibacillus wynnii]|uniref:hypothetical protein n=1 Tax=Paenibacillus wynnii TaxID=268407 RepID=UPI0027903D30|nr:hypothetical protein [Paenibacillus wynnii]MDQ0193632.1 hypothetical protein [Paenibacillus wynnii]
MNSVRYKIRECQDQEKIERFLHQARLGYLGLVEYFKERAIPQRMALKLAVTDSAVNRITSRGKFFEGKLVGACICITWTIAAAILLPDLCHFIRSHPAVGTVQRNIRALT